MVRGKGGAKPGFFWFIAAGHKTRRALVGAVETAVHASRRSCNIKQIDIHHALWL
ncbi:hypothetical protein MIZ03_1338 [Rhodoferax lithotrophicus]|uniref:Uncharacterized protein n=1 Tax=Rhodoferax lithotrophicus TaxID=2798804 RepID=A0ABM7MJK4_9BURK|nr:hypothetical protein MIZ03_1338 [Rhodoferax sp. MIZ03]